MKRSQDFFFNSAANLQESSTYKNENMINSWEEFREHQAWDALPKSFLPWAKSEYLQSRDEPSH